MTEEKPDKKPKTRRVGQVLERGPVVGILFAALLCLTATAQHPQQAITGKVVGVSDGDTISDLVFGKTVTVTSWEKDRYGRTLGTVTLDGKDINLEQVERGMAWFYRQYAKAIQPEDSKTSEQAERAAREEKIGLWADASPVPPWDFTRGKTTKAPGAKPLTPATGPIVGNRNSKIYHLPNCPDYSKVSEKNRVPFKTEAEAQAAGYRKARNCPQ